MLLYTDDLKLFSEVKSEADCMALQCGFVAIYEWSVLKVKDDLFLIIFFSLFLLIKVNKLIRGLRS